jgi:hypothetical protein
MRRHGGRLLVFRSTVAARGFETFMDFPQIWGTRISNIVIAREKMDLVPNHRERQLMQHLRDSGWVKAGTLPHWPRITANLLDRGWIEQQVQSGERFFRITEKGLEAKRAPICISK